MEKVKKTDRRIRKTKAQLHQGLLTLMKRKNIKDITIKELVDEVDINRSTFYLHYTDIYQIMEEIEVELLKEFTEILNAHPSTKIEDSFSFVRDLFLAFDHNRDTCCILMGENGDMAFTTRAETMIEEKIKERLTILFGKDFQISPYLYSFFRSGCLGLLKTWIDEPNTNSSEYMARITYQLVVSMLLSFHPELKERIRTIHQD